jgi:hypothetical protein
MGASPVAAIAIKDNLEFDLPASRHPSASNSAAGVPAHPLQSGLSNNYPKHTKG